MSDTAGSCCTWFRICIYNEVQHVVKNKSDPVRLLIWDTCYWKIFKEAQTPHWNSRSLTGSVNMMCACLQLFVLLFHSMRVIPSSSRVILDLLVLPALLVKMDQRVWGETVDPRADRVMLVSVVPLGLLERREMLERMVPLWVCLT